MEPVDECLIATIQIKRDNVYRVGPKMSGPKCWSAV